jgi:excisionase family DNA binding protein
MMKTLISIADCQEMLGVSRSTIYRLAERGQLEFIHIGSSVRVRLQDVEKLCHKPASISGSLA